MDKMEQNLKEALKIIQEQNAKIERFAKMERIADEGIKMLKHKPNIAKDVKTKLHESAKNGCLEEARLLLKKWSFC